MTIESSGQIALGGAATNASVELELYNSGNGYVAAGTNSISMNDTAVRTLSGTTAGTQVSLSTFYGKSAAATANISISSGTNNYTLSTAQVTGYVVGMHVTLTINSGVVVGSASTGSYALTIDNSWNAADSLTIINNGTITGMGGAGGTGGYGSVAGSVGAAGGPAIYAQRAVSITNNGVVEGGGGGGGGGGGVAISKVQALDGGGGGGGYGSVGGAGGAAGSNGGTPPTTYATAGTNGIFNVGPGSGGSGSIVNTSYGGAGGSGGAAGASGNNGSSGSSGSLGTVGGAGGACTSGNSYITWTVAGQKYGAIN